MENTKEIYVLYFNTRDELVRVDLRRVLYFAADRNYTDVYFQNGHHVTLPTNLANIEKMLSQTQLNGRLARFVRIGRSLIVNLAYILHINLLRQELVLSDMVSPNVVHVPVAKEALKKLKDLY